MLDTKAHLPILLHFLLLLLLLLLLLQMVLTLLVTLLMASLGGVQAGSSSPAKVGVVLFHVFFSLADMAAAVAAELNSA